MSRKYEAIIVIDAKGKEDSIDSLVNQLTRDFESKGAKLQQVDNLGRKKFPYAPRHVDGGWYVNVHFESEPAAVDQIRDVLKVNENVYQQYYQRV